MAKRPLIGVSGPDRGGLAAWGFTALALQRAGARVQRITPKRTADLHALDGLVISGGADINPALYGQPKTVSVAEFQAQQRERFRRFWSLAGYPLHWALRRSLLTYDPSEDEARERMEYRLIKLALQQGLPLLGIGRGMQLLNVVCQGTLHQSLYRVYGTTAPERTPFARKTVILTPQTRLAQRIGHTPIKVNALHHQAIDRLGHGLCMAAQDHHGLIQAIEHRDHPHIFGVQWHPHYLPHKTAHQAVFHALVQAAHTVLAARPAR